MAAAPPLEPLAPVSELVLDPLDESPALVPRDVVEPAPDEPGRPKLPVASAELLVPAEPLVPRLLPLVPLLPAPLVSEELVPDEPVASLELLPLVPLVPKLLLPLVPLVPEEVPELRFELPLEPEFEELPCSDELPELSDEEPCDPATCSSC